MIGEDVAEALGSRGYDVVRVSAIGMSRSDDAEILEEAIRNDRILITLDDHFGDWAVLPLSDQPGVIRIRANPATGKTIISLLNGFFDQHEQHDLSNTLVILSTRTRWISTKEAR